MQDHEKQPNHNRQRLPLARAGKPGQARYQWDKLVLEAESKTPKAMIEAGPSGPAPSGPQSQKILPQCAQNFLKGRISGKPADITLHDGGGGLPNWLDNSVTYGQDIHLGGDMFGRRDSAALMHKFHEIRHASQNARMGLNPFDHFAAYLAFGGHDASPLEQDAENFSRDTYKAYKAARLDKTCPF